MKAASLKFTGSRLKWFSIVITEEQLEDVMFEIASVLTAFIVIGSLVNLIGVIGNVG